MEDRSGGMARSSGVLGIIPARGGSKRVPGKNLRSLCGKPLIAWTIEAALASEVCDRLIVSTDSPEIAEVAKQWGAEVPGLRPEALSGDTARTTDVIAHVRDSYGDARDVLAWFNPTTPLRSAADIRAAWAAFREIGCAGAVLTVTQSPLPREWIWDVDPAGRIRLESLTTSLSMSRSQDFARRFVPNGGAYFVEPEYFSRHTFLGPQAFVSVMPPERSVDIDTEIDFAFAEFLIRRGS